MKNNGTEIFVNVNPFESRVAIVEQGRLAEFYVERLKDRVITGNIYKGRVVRVLPGMQSAFIDIGIQRTAFIHVS
ncbi:MAG: Rne/Rng family ribonuclease, partial [Deltaproteobacteria bacterium]|nr:Rne/Rng family ribonuclease [Deltaproteobacteria bacterium]